MKRTIIPALLISLAFTFSCGTTSEQKQASTETEKVDNGHQNDHEQANTAVSISLNNGSKWNSDESTFTGMKRLEMTLFNFDEENKDASIADYNKLGEALAKINKDIISQCSMQGEDHDQLHILLAPMLTNVDVIKNGDSVIEATENKEALSQSIAQFFEHFEVK